MYLLQDESNGLTDEAATPAGTRRPHNTFFPTSCFFAAWYTAIRSPLKVALAQRVVRAEDLSHANTTCKT